MIFDFVEKGAFPGNRFEGVGNVFLEGVVVWDEHNVECGMWNVDC